jgi:hypothetical protein
MSNLTLKIFLAQQNPIILPRPKIKPPQDYPLLNNDEKAKTGEMVL